MGPVWHNGGWQSNPRFNRFTWFNPYNFPVPLGPACWAQCSVSPVAGIVFNDRHSRPLSWGVQRNQSIISGECFTCSVMGWFFSSWSRCKYSADFKGEQGEVTAKYSWKSHPVLDFSWPEWQFSQLCFHKGAFRSAGKAARVPLALGSHGSSMWIAANLEADSALPSFDSTSADVWLASLLLSPHWLWGNLGQWDSHGGTSVWWGELLHWGSRMWGTLTRPLALLCISQENKLVKMPGKSLQCGMSCGSASSQPRENGLELLLSFFSLFFFFHGKWCFFFHNFTHFMFL